MLTVLAAFSPLLHGELLPIKTYTTADGLASDQINGITADSRGFLWFCTPEGLSRFDGYHFVNYGAAAGLPHDTVYVVRETRSGDHWIGTARGLSRIAPGGNPARFTNYSVPQATGSNYAFSVIESRSGKMLAANWEGLMEWTDPLHFRRREFSVPPTTRFSDIAEDAEGNLWAGAHTGLFLLEASGVMRSFTPRDGLPGKWVNMLMADSKGRMWAALRGGLAQFSRQAGEWRLENVYSAASGLASPVVQALCEASDGTIWVGTTQGINRLRWSGGSRPAIENLNRAQGLSDRAITALAEDQAGNMWAGTESAGVMRIGRVGFTTYRERDGLRSDRVWSLTEGRAGELLAGTIPADHEQTRSLDIFDGVRFHNLAPVKFSDHSSWGWNQVFLQSRTGEWWAATRDGLCRFDAVKAADLDRRKPRMCYLPGATIFRIFEDSQGGIWASEQNNAGDRLWRWDPGTNSVADYPRIGLVSAFAGDRQGNVWMGMFGGGLYRYRGGEFQRFRRSDGLPGGGVLALLISQSGLWIGTNGGGLGRIANPAEERPTIAVYNASRGMSSNIVQVLVDDRAGRIYAGTGKGVDRLDPGSGHVRHFSAADGLARGAFHGALRDRSGTLWFATTQGLSRLIPQTDQPAVKPRVLITELRIGGAQWAVSKLGETRIGPLELKPSQNQVQAEFVGIDYEPGDLVRYSYKLQGAYAEWSPPRNQPSVNFAALAAGTYHFLVKAVTSEGMESAPAEIDFTVLPPFYKQWWFLALAVAVASALVFGAHRYRLAQMVNLERMRTAIATDLHDDIGASLSQIAILSEVARVGGNGRGPDEPLDRVATLARELVDSMGDIVWSIRAEPRGMDSLVRRMREFALDVLGSQGIEFQLRAAQTEEVKLSLQARRQLFLMFKECVHNAARHSGCTAVVAEIKAGDREVMLMVEDNGAGLNGKDRAPGATGGTGIAGMRRRAESLGGRMELTSQAGQGCRVKFCLPVPRSGVGFSLRRA
jgi:ligand-binding sensor domain-containing protein/signal transduction histidine kinase